VSVNYDFYSHNSQKSKPSTNNAFTATMSNINPTRPPTNTTATTTITAVIPTVCKTYVPVSSKFAANDGIKEVQFNVTLTHSGRLGIKLQKTGIYGVASINFVDSDSILLDYICVGDKLIAIDDEDVDHLLIPDLCDLMKESAEKGCKLTLLGSESQKHCTTNITTDTVSTEINTLAIIHKRENRQQDRLQMSDLVDTDDTDEEDDHNHLIPGETVKFIRIGGFQFSVDVVIRAVNNLTVEEGWLDDTNIHNELRRLQTVFDENGGFPYGNDENELMEIVIATP
jgi:hypothetical protein